jgi:hypothetical protein
MRSIALLSLLLVASCTRIEVVAEHSLAACDVDASMDAVADAVPDAPIDAAPDAPPDAPPTPKTLIAILGQSNAVGIGLQSRLTNQSLASSYPNVVYEATTAANSITPIVWETYARGPLAPFYYQSGNHFGIELTLGRDLDATAQGQFAIVKFAVNGTTLANKWSPTGTVPTSGSGNFAHLALTAVQSAQQACACDRVVFVWIQGEADAGSSSQSAAYATNLAGLAAFYRQTYPAAPWVVGRLNGDYINAANNAGAYTSTVRAAEQQFVASDPHAALVDMDSVLPDPANHTHYFADGYAQLGHLYATAVLGL